MRGKNVRCKLKYLFKIRYYVLGLTLIIGACAPVEVAEAAHCPALRIVFARGSGGERWKDANYLAFKESLEEKLATLNLDYEFIDLDYPAVGIGVNKLGVTLGALFGAGEGYEFGASVKSGVKNLDNMVNSAGCPRTKYVLGGYSQGAMVVSKALRSLNADRVIYAATFGDPKIYLPEGKGLIPAACRGSNLSDYRMYVPDCRAYRGLLGSYIPYEPEAYFGKLGTWCNKRDAFCSSHLNVSDHLAYTSDHLYEDASKVIFDKITHTFGLSNTFSSMHDTAILVDASGEMQNLFSNYKMRIADLAARTLEADGRIALYSYRGAGGGLKKYCDFNTCTMSEVKISLERIHDDCTRNDVPESLMSTSFRIMEELRWKEGATKSLVVLTESNFSSPDRTGMSLDEVAKLSKRIDPVNFYIVTNSELIGEYNELAGKTDGAVVSGLNGLESLVENIMTRFDSLPRVEEENIAFAAPVLQIEGVEKVDDTSVRIKFSTNGVQTLISLNDAIIGVTGKKEVTVQGLDFGADNNLVLTPLGEDIHGEAVEVNLSGYGGVKEKDSAATLPLVPRAPNTGAKSNLSDSDRRRDIYKL